MIDIIEKTVIEGLLENDYDDVALQGNDAGKEAIFTSVSKWFKNQEVKILYGPFTHPYEKEFEINEKIVVKTLISEPNWVIELKSGRRFMAMKSELKFK